MVRFGRRSRPWSVAGKRLFGERNDSEQGAIATEEREALLAREEAAPEQTPADKGDGPPPDPTQRLLTALGRFQRQVSRAEQGAPQHEWSDACIEQLITGMRIAHEEGWGNVREALTDTARVLQTYEEYGVGDRSLPFLQDAYEILCLMVGDLLVDNVRSGVRQKWQKRFEEEVDALSADGMKLIRDEEELEELHAAESPIPYTPVAPVETPEAEDAPAAEADEQDDQEDWAPEETPFEAPAVDDGEDGTHAVAASPFDEPDFDEDDDDTSATRWEAPGDPWEEDDASVPAEEASADTAEPVEEENLEEAKVDQEGVLPAWEEEQEEQERAFATDWEAEDAEAPAEDLTPEEDSEEEMASGDALEQAPEEMEDLFGGRIIDFAAHRRQEPLFKTEPPSEEAAPSAEAEDEVASEEDADMLEQPAEVQDQKIEDETAAIPPEVIEEEIVAETEAAAETPDHTLDAESEMALDEADQALENEPAAAEEAAEPAEAVAEIPDEAEEDDEDEIPVLAAASLDGEAEAPEDVEAAEAPQAAMAEMLLASADAAMLPAAPKLPPELDSLFRAAHDAMVQGNAAAAKSLTLQLAARMSELEVSKAEEFLRDAEGQLSSNSRAIAAAEDRVRHAEKLVEETEQTAELAQRVVEEQHGSMAELREQAGIVEAGIADIDRQIDELQRRRETEAARLEGLRERLSGNEAEEDRLKSEMDSFGETLVAQQEALAAARQEAAELRTLHTRCQQGIVAAREELERRRAAHQEIRRTLGTGEEASTGADDTQQDEAMLF